jgi:hypothetical protein
MSGRVPLSPLSVSAKPFGFQRLVASATWPSGTSWYGPADFVGLKNEDSVTAPQRTNGLCGRPRTEIDAELMIVIDRILILIGGLSK